MRLFNFLKNPGLPVNNQINQDVVELFLGLKSANTQRQYRKIISEFVEFVVKRGGGLGSAKESDAMAFATWALNQEGEKERHSDKKTNVTEATVFRKVIVLKGLYKAAGVLPNPFETVCDRLRHAQVGTKRPTEAITAEQVTRLLNVPSEFSKDGIRDRAFLAALFGGGLRISEVCGLRLGDIRKDGAVCYLHLGRTKSKNTQEQTLPDWAAGRLLRLAEERVREGANNNDPLFIFYTRNQGRNINSRAYFAIFKKLAYQAGLPKTISPHSGRATACTHLLESGLDYKQAKDFMRHSSFQMVEKYDKRRRARKTSPALKLNYEK